MTGLGTLEKEGRLAYSVLNEDMIDVYILGSMIISKRTADGSITKTKNGTSFSSAAMISQAISEDWRVCGCWSWDRTGYEGLNRASGGML